MLIQFTMVVLCTNLYVVKDRYKLLIITLKCYVYLAIIMFSVQWLDYPGENEDNILPAQRLHLLHLTLLFALNSSRLSPSLML